MQNIASSKKHLCRISKFAEESGLFTEGSRPSTRTVHNWKRDGILEMVQIGNSSFVDIDKTRDRIFQSDVYYRSRLK